MRPEPAPSGAAAWSSVARDKAPGEYPAWPLDDDDLHRGAAADRHDRSAGPRRPNDGGVVLSLRRAGAHADA